MNYTLVDRLHVESDLCRNDGATDIADLIDEAIAALSQADEPVDEPTGYVLVPCIGTLVTADHPITVLNPTKVFAVHEIKYENGKFYARGKETMWFGIALLKSAMSPDGETK